MAKKQAKKPSKKPSKKRAASISTAAAQILGECAFATAQGMEREMATDTLHRPYDLLPDARDFWLAKHIKSIPYALAKYRPNWPHDRPGVLLMSAHLGQRAAVHAMADATAADPIIQVTRAHVKAASTEVKNDPRCVAVAKAKRPGSGIYCEV